MRCSIKPLLYCFCRREFPTRNLFPKGEGFRGIAEKPLVRAGSCPFCESIGDAKQNYNEDNNDNPKYALREPPDTTAGILLLPFLPA